MKTNFISVKTLLVALSASAALTLAGTTSATAQSATQAVASANPLKPRVTRVGETLNFEVRFENPNADRISVDIQDDRSNNLFRDVAHSNAPRYARRFDLSGLEDGTYTFVISNGKDRYTESFELRTQVQTSRSVLNKQ